MDPPVSFRALLKPVLKRGCLVAAANWPVTLVQSVADSIFKLLLAVPIIGGIFLVALVVGAEPGSLMDLEWRDLAATLVAALLSHPLVLAAFLLSVAVMSVGGSTFVFLVKGGTVGVLVRGETEAGPIEVPPLHFEAVARAATFSIELFVDSARRLFPRYTRLGLILMAVYIGSGGVYLAAVFVNRRAGDLWLLAAIFTVAFVAWITLVNLVYLLIQIVIAVDDCSVRAATSRASVFIRQRWHDVGGVFAIVLIMVVVATGASFVATASLGLMTFVPFVGPFIGLAVLPLQLLAWVLREIVFHYIGLSSIGAYVKLYRGFAAPVEQRAVAPMPGPTLIPTSGP